jgi:hypothetical protein
MRLLALTAEPTARPSAVVAAVTLYFTLRTPPPANPVDTASAGRTSAGE